MHTHALSQAVSASASLTRIALNVAAMVLGGRAWCGNGDIVLRVPAHTPSISTLLPASLRRGSSSSTTPSADSRDDHDGAYYDYGSQDDARVVCARDACVQWQGELRNRVDELATDLLLGQATTTSAGAAPLIDECSGTSLLLGDSGDTGGYGGGSALNRTSGYYQLLPRVDALMRSLRASLAGAGDSAASGNSPGRGTSTTSSRGRGGGGGRGRSERLAAEAAAAASAAAAAAAGGVGGGGDAISLKLLRALHRVLAQSSHDWAQLDALLGDLQLLEVVAPALAGSVASSSPAVPAQSPAVRVAAMQVLCQVATNACFRQTARLWRDASSPPRLSSSSLPVSQQVAAPAFMRLLCALAAREEVSASAEL
jgi:hypothetical protein